MTAPLPPDDDALIAEYALGLLPRQDAQAMALRLAKDPALAARLRVWHEHLAQHADLLAPAPPPDRVKLRIDDALGGPVRTRRQKVRRWAVGWLAALLVAGALAGAVLLRPGPAPRHVAELTARDTGAAYRLQVDLRQRTATAQLKEGAAAPGRDHEIWWLQPGAPPVSVGLMPHRGTVRLDLPDGLGAPRGVHIGLSDEAAGGSVSGLPSQSFVAQVPLRPL